MIDCDKSDLGIELDKANGRLRVEDGSISIAEIRHVIVNRDANEKDMIAGAVVIQTMPGGLGLLPATNANSYEFIVHGKSTEDALQKGQALETLSVDLRQFAADYGVGVTTTHIPQDLFHKTFGEVG